MALAKERLIWDATAASDSDTVGTAHSYPEDSAHTTGDYGAFVLAVRNDAGTPLAADGDYIPFTTDSSGALRVTGGGGGTEFAEDSAHSSGHSGRFILSVRVDDVPEGSNAAFLADTEGDYQAILTDARGGLWTANTFNEDQAHTTADAGAFVLSVRNDALAALAGADGDYAPFQVDASGALYVNTGTAAAAALADNTANPTASQTAAFGMVWDGATWDRMPGTSADGVTVNLGTNNDVTATGNVADDAADTGNPLKVGSRVETGALAAIADGDRADLLSDDFRRIWVNSAPNVSAAQTQISVSGVLVALPTTALTGRTRILIQNVSAGAANSVFVGGAGTTTGDGIRISAGAAVTLDIGDDVTLSGISGGTADVRILELA